MQYQDIAAIDDPKERQHWIDRLDPASKRGWYRWWRKVKEYERKHKEATRGN